MPWSSNGYTLEERFCDFLKVKIHASTPDLNELSKVLDLNRRPIHCTGMWKALN